MDIDGDADFLLQRADQMVSGIRSEQARHIFDADGIRSHVHQLMGQMQIIGIFVIRADRIDERALRMSAGSLRGLHGTFDVADIIESVEDTDDIDAVGDTALDEFRDHIIGIVVVAEDILPAEEHLEFRILDMLADRAKAFPRIFVQIAQAGIESSTAPGFQGIKTTLIQRFQDRKHIADAHPCRAQGLMPIAKDSFNDLYRI